MMTAKSRGNGLIVVFDEAATERPSEENARAATTSARSRT